MNTETIFNLLSFLSFAIVIALIYFVKAFIDDDVFLNKYPAFKQKSIRVLFMLLSGSLVVGVLVPSLFPYSYYLFIVVFIFSLIVFGRILSENKTKITLGHNKGPFVGKAAYLSIPYNQYISVAPGVMDRRIINKRDREFMQVRAIYPVLSNVDFSKNYVLLVKFTEDCNFQMHWHMSDEVIHVLSGVIKDRGKAFAARSNMYIPAYEEHEFIGIEGGLACIELSKTIK